jgi:glutamate 5-kinase
LRIVFMARAAMKIFNSKSEIRNYDVPMPSTPIRKTLIARARRVVVKVGTSSICRDSSGVDRPAVESLAGQIASLRRRGVRVTLVASGAIGAGRAELGLKARPKALAELQAVAAVGQGQLMREFHDAFAREGIPVAQVLLTRDDFEHRGRYLNIRNTLAALEKLGALPIINENDTVGVEEIRYGDNDMIAALVAGMLRADLAIFLTTAEGVLKDGQVVDLVSDLSPEVLALARPEKSRLGSGGMASKLAAAGAMARSGEPAVIAPASAPGVLERILDGERVGTVFAPARGKISSRRRWIAQASRSAGKILVDDGASAALLEKGKSLLPSGVKGVLGDFERGATVSVIDRAGRQIARGVVNYSSRQIDLIKGLKTAQIAKALGAKPFDEVIHRNNMTVG